MIEDALRRRELGLLSQDPRLLTHRPHAFQRAATADEGLVSRLQLTTQLPASGCLFVTGWDGSGARLVSAGEDCRLRIWCGDGSNLLHTVDTGHTSSILAAQFLLHRPDQVICGSADKQIRHVNLSRGGARPYVLHRGCVRALVPLDSHVVLSGSQDGTVREVDVRIKPPPLTRTQELQPASEDYNVLVDQRAERIGRTRARVGVHSIAVDEHRPWLILTGGSDPLLRLYDRRMLPPPSDGHGSRSKAPQWVSCFIPAHLKADLWDSRPAAAPAAASGTAYQLTAVAFARGGSEVVGSYSGHCIYSFDCVEHARDVESLLHVPESVLRVPTRPRSNVRRSAHQWAPLQQQVPPDTRSPATRPLAAYQGLSQAGSMQQLVGQAGTSELQMAGGGGGGGGGGGQGQSQGTGRAGPRIARHRAIGIGASLRHLEHLRRQHSQIRSPAAGGGRGGEHAESSRPSPWQQRPSSSTLRSPLHGPRYLPPASTAAAGASGGPSSDGVGGGARTADAAGHLQQPQQQQPEGGAAYHLPQSGSEMSGEGSPLAGERRGMGEAGRVRRSRRLLQRRRGLAHGAGAGSIAEDAAAEEAVQMEVDGGEAAIVAEAGPALPQPAISGIAELSGASESDIGEEVGPTTAAVHSPSRRRASRRLAAAAAAAAAGEQQQQQLGGAEAAGEAGPVEPCAPGGAAGGLPGAALDFKHPAAGRLPPRQLRHRQPHAAEVFDTGWVDSTLGLMQQHIAQPDSSEVAAASPHAYHGVAQQAQQQQAVQQAAEQQAAQQQQQQQPEVTVDMQQQPTLQASGGGRGPSPVAEVTSRPVVSGSVIGAVATRRSGGHEVSSLNSAGAAGLERVDSVAQRPPREAPSVGNAPRTATTLATTAHRREAPEASTGHMGPPRPAHPLNQAQQQAQQHQRGAPPSPREQPQLQQPPQLAWQQGGPAANRPQQQWQGPPGRHPLPTASTGTSRPPSFTGGFPAAGAAARGGALASAAGQASGAGAGAAAAAAGAVPPAMASGRGALRPRRHPGLDHSSALNVASHAGGAAAVAVEVGGRGAVAAADEGTSAAPHVQQQQQQQQQQQYPVQHTHNLRRQQGQPQHGQQAQQAGAAAQQQQQQQALSLMQPQATMLSGRGPSTVGNFLPPSQQAQRLSEGEVGLESFAEERAGQQAAADRAAGSGQGVGTQQAQQGPPDSAIGAILHVADTEGEEVIEPTMYRCCYWGHLNLMDSLDGNGVAATPNVAFLGADSEFLAAPSDDGSLFIWDYATGALVSVLGSGGEEGLACVAPHPHAPMLASCGYGSVVQLWSPEAQERCDLERALQTVEQNARALMQADLQPPAQPPPGLTLMGAGRGPQVYRGEDGRQVRCNMM